MATLYPKNEEDIIPSRTIHPIYPKLRMMMPLSW